MLKPSPLGTTHATVFLLDKNTDTFIGINNHFSWLSADKELEAIAILNFYDSNGNHLAKQNFELGYFQSQAISAREVLSQVNCPSEYGLFSASIRPKNRFSLSVKSLGRTTGIFYVFHRHANGSVALLHPNGRVGKSLNPSKTWKSLQIISTLNLEAIVLYQHNCGNYNHSTNYRLIDIATGKIFKEIKISLRPYGTQKIIFELDETELIPTELSLACDSLPSDNAKPLLMRKYKSGHYSISHS
jgi:hypothetical protein